MCLGSPLKGLGKPLEGEGMTGSLAASTSIRGIALMVGGDPPLHVAFVAAPGELLAPGGMLAPGKDTFCPWGLFVSLLGLPVCAVTCVCIISASVFSSTLAD